MERVHKRTIDALDETRMKDYSFESFHERAPLCGAGSAGSARYTAEDWTAPG